MAILGIPQGLSSTKLYAHFLDVYTSEGGAYLERTRWDPKDGELCLVRTKPGETLVEVRSDSDVQIDRQTWV